MSKNVNNVESCQHWAQGKFWSSKKSQFLVINMWEKILRITLKYFCVPMLAVPVKCNLCQSHPKPGLPHSPHMQRSQSLLEQPKIASFPVCRIILGSPKHVLHLVWSVLGIYTAITSSKAGGCASRTNAYKCRSVNLWKLSKVCEKWSKVCKIVQSVQSCAKCAKKNFKICKGVQNLLTGLKRAQM